MLTAKLCKACEAGDVREVEELLMSGATPNFAPSGNCYRYPLHCAASSGHAEIVKLLLQHEATVDPLEASSGWTPLMIATLKSAKSQKHIDVMMVLLEGGADAEVIDARGNTILHILASRGQTELLKQLLQKIPSLDILGPGFGYMTPLHYATEAGHVDTVEFLLQLKADPRGVDASGWTPVHWACRRGHKQVVDLLLSYGGSIEDRDFRSLTPLDVAYLFNHTALAKLLDAQMIPRDKRAISTPDVQPSEKGSPIFEDDTGGVPQEDSRVGAPTVEHSGCSFTTCAWGQGQHHLGRNGRTLARLALGIFIVVLSVCDYLSRFTMAVFIAAAARTFEGLGPMVIAATVLACCSVMLPSVALGICCSCHFKNTSIWAAWRAAKFIHALEDRENGEGEKALQPTLLALKDLRFVNLLRRLITRTLCPESPTLLTFAAAVCILPPAAVVCCFILMIQIVVIIVATLIPVVSLGTISFVWISALKAFIISRRGFLLYLDCLTHASARLMNSTEGSTQHHGSLCTPRVHVLPRNRTRRIKPDGERGLETSRESTESAYPSESLSSSMFGQNVRCAGEKPMEPKPHSVCSPAHPDNEGRAIENKETRTQCQQDARCEYLVPPVQRFLYYTSATYCGSVPRKLHPCPSLQGAIQLHRQHLDINGDRQCRRCLVTHWKRRFQLPERSMTSSSNVSGAVLAGELVTVERRSAVPGKSSSTRRGSSGGRVDSSSSHEYAQGSDSISVVSGESKEKLWLSNLEEGSATSPHASGQSQVIMMALENNTANPWLPGILEFVYGSEVHESEAVSEIHAGAPNFDRVFLKEATIPRWNDNVGWGTDREAYRLPCVTPCSSMQQKIKQENPAVGLTVPPESPLVVSHEGPVSPQNFEDRGLRPEKFISRLRSYPKAALPLACLHAKASCKAFQLLFTGALSERRLASAETVGDQKGHMQRNPEVLCTFRDLKKRGQWPLKPHTNYAEYDVMVAQRERHIFNWFERVVASRYAAVTVVSKSEPTKVNEMTSETGSCSSECGLGDDLPRESRQSPSVDQMGAGIKWATFSTLFPQSDNTAQVDGLKGALPTPTLEGEKRVPCLRTEDLFDFPVEEPVTSDGRQYPCCKGHFLKRGFEPSRNKMGKLCLGFSGSLHSSKVGGPAIPGGGRSIRGESGSDQIDSPILHYRFKDMVELPHLRETFFSLWCREFENLLLYQDQYLGEKNLLVTGAVGKDGIGGISLMSTPRPAGRRGHNCLEPPEPPMTCSVAVSRAALGLSTRKAVSKRRWPPGKTSLHGPLKPQGIPLVHSNTASDLVSKFGCTEEETEMDECTTADNKKNAVVLVAETCRFFFALSLTLDLLLGLLPLLGATIAFYLLPYRAFSYPKPPEATALSFPDVCSQSDSGTTSFFALFLLFQQMTSLTSTFCAFRHLFLWSLGLTSAVAFLYAALLFSQASRVFFPLERRKYKVDFERGNKPTAVAGGHICS